MAFLSVFQLIDTIFAYRLSREFTFREMEALSQKDWLPILSALRHNEWFKKVTIENTKLVCFLSSDIRSFTCH